jgi:hypothetical protein
LQWEKADRLMESHEHREFSLLTRLSFTSRIICMMPVYTSRVLSLYTVTAKVLPNKSGTPHMTPALPYFPGDHAVTGQAIPPE